MENTLAYLIPLVAIAGGIAYAIFARSLRSKERVALATSHLALCEDLHALQQLTETARARTDAIEKRLAGLEDKPLPVVDGPTRA